MAEAKLKVNETDPKPESKIIEGFKFGFGFYLAFLAGSLILAALTAIVWFIVKGI